MQISFLNRYCFISTAEPKVSNQECYAELLVLFHNYTPTVRKEYLESLCFSLFHCSFVVAKSNASLRSIINICVCNYCCVYMKFCLDYRYYDCNIL